MLIRSHSPICPVTAIINYLWVRGSRLGPLFLCEKGMPLTREKFNGRLQTVLKKCDIPDKYTLHSFRVGAATTAASLGFPEYLIKALGRWSSEAYKVYIKLPMEQLTLASRKMAGIS